MSLVPLARNKPTDPRALLIFFQYIHRELPHEARTPASRAEEGVVDQGAEAE